MSRFLFTGSQGHFAIPDGESRVGSDSACPVCIQGEGILPVHAYLKVEGDRLLIRPSSEKSTILVDGQPVQGPQTLRDGQDVSIGPLRMRVETQGAARRSLWRSRWVRWPIYVFAGCASLLLVVVLLRYLWFNDAWWKARIIAQVEKALHREDVEIQEVQVTLLEGEFLIQGLHVPNKKELLIEEKYLLHIPEIRGKIEPWPLIRSRLKEIRASSLTLNAPELLIERFSRSGHVVTNVDDILSQYMEGPPRVYPIDLGLAALETELQVENGRIRLRDRYTRAEGDTSLEKIELRLAQSGFGEKLTYKLSALSHTPNQPDGKVGLDGGFKLINDAGQIDTKDIGEGKACLELVRFDLARLCSHLDWSILVYNGQLQIVPAKPLNGLFNLNFQNLKGFKIDGWAESESVLSVVEKDRPPIGNIPTYMAVDLNYDVARGPVEMRLDIRSAATPQAARDPSQPQILTLEATGKPDARNDYVFDGSFNAHLQEFCATDVGERLKLKDCLKGRLTGTTRLVRAATGEWRKIDASLAVEKGEVWVPNPKGEGGVWQPTSFTANWETEARPNKQGEIAALEANFRAKAGSFEAESTMPAKLESLDNWNKLKVHTWFKLKLNGREFWKEFKPVLDLLGYSTPREEILKLDVVAYSDAHDQNVPGSPPSRISISMEGEAQPQWKSDPGLIKKLRAVVDYFPEVFAQGVKGFKLSTPDAEVPPYLKLSLQTGDEATPPYVSIRNAELRRDGSREILTVDQKIHSDLAALRERFDPYLSQFAEYAGLRQAYRNYVWTGNLAESGNFRIRRNAFPAAAEPPQLEVDFDATLSGQNLVLEGPLPGSLKPDGPYLRWKWMEPKPQVALKGNYHIQAAANDEDPPRESLDLETLDMNGRLGAFKLSMRNVDLWALQNLNLDRKTGAARAMGKVLPDILDGFKFTGEVTPAAFDLLRTLGQLPVAPLVSGSLKLNADYKRQFTGAGGKAEEGGRLSLKELIFENLAPQGGFWLKNLNVLAEVRDVHDLFIQAAAGHLNPLEHLGEYLVVRSLAVDADAFSNWIAAHPEQAQKLRIPGTLASLIRDGSLVPQGTWKVDEMALRPSPQKDLSWNLVGKFQNDFRYTLPALPGGEPSEPTVLVFKGPWRIDKEEATAFSFLKDYRTQYVMFHANFDAADIRVRNLLPKWDYIKLENQPLKLRLAGWLSPGKDQQDTLYNLQEISLVGGPQPITCTDLEAETRADELQSLSLKSVKIQGGLLPATLRDLKFSRKEDQLSFGLEAPAFALNYLTQLGKKILGFTPQGQLANFRVTWSGVLSNLRKLDFTSSQDRFETKGELKELVLEARPGQGEETSLTLNGDYVLSGPEFRSSAFDAILRMTSPGGEGRPPNTVLQGFSLAKGGLWVASNDEKLNLFGALEQDPLPLRLKLPLKIRNTLDPAALEAAGVALERILRKHWLEQLDDCESRKAGFQKKLETLGEENREARELLSRDIQRMDDEVRKLKKKLSTEKLNANPYQALERIQVEGSLSAPQCRVGAETFGQLEVPSYTLKDLKVSLPLATSKYAGGELTISEASYDLNNPRILHDQHLKLAFADLQQLVPIDPAQPDATCKTEGRLSLEGALKGTGFSPRDRLTWDGGMEVTLHDLVLESPRQANKPKTGARYPPWLESSALSPALKDAETKLLGKAVLAYADLAKSNPLLQGATPWLNGSVLGLQLYLSVLGFDASRFDFETTRVVVTIRQGFLDIPRGRLVGKGTSTGLELAFRGRINLLDQTIQDEFLLWPVKLPETARQALSLDRWPQDIREQFLADLADGKLALRITGSTKDPQLAYPMDKLRRYAMLATFGQERIDSAPGLETARAAFLRSWGTTEPGIDAGANLLDRLGAGLPSTQTSQYSGSHILERLHLPPQLEYLKSIISFTPEKTLLPGASLRKLLFPPPPDPKSGVPANPKDPAPPAKAPAPKQPEPAQPQKSDVDKGIEILEEMRKKREREAGERAP